MGKSGWKIIPAAFFLLLNFSVAHNRFLFSRQLVYFSFLLFFLLLLRTFPLKNILPPAIAGVSLILFIYGLIQKWIIFPRLLEAVQGRSDFISQAIAIRIRNGRIYAIFEMPTLYAMVCGILLIFILHQWIHSPRRLPRLLWTLLALLGTANLILTKSFGGIISLTVALSLYLILTRKITIRYAIPIFMALLLLGLLIVGMRFSEAKSLEPLHLRLSNWLQAMRLVGSSPVLGVGLGNYPIVVPQQVFPGEVPSVYAHNSILQVAAEAGLPLAVFLMLMAIFYLKKNASPFLAPENAAFTSALLLNILFNTADIGIFFTASGIAFVVCLSQLLPEAEEKRKKSLWVLCLASLLLWMGFDYAEGLQRQASLLASQNQIEQARSLYRRSLAITPFSHQGLIGLLETEMAAGSQAGIEARLNQVLELFPQSGYANWLQSQVDYRKGEYLRCLFHAQAAMAANKRNSEYRRWYERVYQNFKEQLDHPGN